MKRKTKTSLILCATLWAGCIEQATTVEIVYIDEPCKDALRIDDFQSAQVIRVSGDCPDIGTIDLTTWPLKCTDELRTGMCEHFRKCEDDFQTLWIKTDGGNQALGSMGIERFDCRSTYAVFFDRVE